MLTRVAAVPWMAVAGCWFTLSLMVSKFGRVGALRKSDMCCIWKDAEIGTAGSSVEDGDRDGGWSLVSTRGCGVEE